MATPRFTPEELQELYNLAAQWAKTVSKRAFGDDGPGLDVDFRTFEQIAAAAQGLTEGTFPLFLQQQAQRRTSEQPCPDCGTYVPTPSGFMYPAATIDWFGRFVVSWKLSNALDGAFCQEMLEEALGRGTPEVFNADQGVQFTVRAWARRLEGAGVSVSMDGKGRCLDNIFVERQWRSVKYEYACSPGRCWRWNAD